MGYGKIMWVYMRPLYFLALLLLASSILGGDLEIFDRQDIHRARFDLDSRAAEINRQSISNHTALPVGQALADIQISESISPARFDQSDPAVVELADGRWLAAWQDEREGYFAIYWQVLDNTGSPIGSNQPIAVSATGRNFVEPQLAVDTLGRIYLLYRDRTGGLIYGTRFLGDLSVDLAAFVVNDTLFSSFAGPFAFDIYPNGRMVVAWENYSVLGSTIQTRIISSSGSFVTGPITVNTDGGLATHWVPSVSVEPTSGFLVAWEDYRNMRADIYARLFSGTGAPVGSDFGIVPAPANGAAQYAPQTALLDTDRYVIAWIDTRSGQQVYGQEYSTNSGLVGGNVRISSDSVAVAWDVAPNAGPDGVLAVTWASFGITNQTLMARFPSGLTGQSSIVPLTAVTPGRQWGPDVSFDTPATFALVRTEIVSDDPDVTLEIFDTLGNTPRSPGLILNDDAVGAQSRNPQIAATSDWWNVVAYSDQRYDDGDIFVHRITNALELSGTSQRINQDHPGHLQSEPSLAVLRDSEVLVVWVDSRPVTGQSGQRIYGRFGNQFGVFSDPEFMISDTLQVAAKQHPSAALSPLGQGLVVWLDDRDPASTLYGCWLNQGDVDGASFLVATGENIQPESIGAYFADGKFFIVWLDAAPLAATLYCQTYRENKSSGPFFSWQPPSITATLDEVATDVNASAHIAAAWVGTADTTRELHAVVLDSLGNTVATAAAVVTNVAAVPDDPAVGIDDDGNVAVTWVDRREGKRKIYYQILDNALIPAELPQPVSAADPALMQQPHVSADRGRAWFTWADPRSDGLNIFAATLLYEPTDAGSGDEPALPENYALYQNYPNPFNPSTIIAFSIPRQSEVELAVYNMLGQRVATLVRRPLAAGEHSVVWDGTSESGSRVASGIYLYRLTAGDFVDQKKMILLK